MNEREGKGDKRKEQKGNSMKRQHKDKKRKGMQGKYKN